MLFWLICALITVAVTVFTLRPLLTGERGEDEGQHLHDLQVYKDQLREIENEQHRGVIGAQEAEAARLEISRRILVATDAGRDAASMTVATAQSRSTVFSITAAFIVAASLTVYLLLGEPGYPGRPFAERANTPANQASIADLIARVEARLREAPEDGQGWDVLAPVYAKQGRYSDAIRAFSRAIEILGENRARLRGLAESHLALNNGIVSSEVRDAFRKILVTEPALVAPRFWLAVGLEQDGKRDAAIAAYENLLNDARMQVEKGEIPKRAQTIIEERLAALGATAEPGGPSAAAAPQGKDEDQDRAAIARLPAQERAQMIESMVAGLAERLKSEGGNRADWERLIRSYWVLGRRKAAEDALAGARRQFASDEAVRSGLDAFARELGMEPQ